MLILNRARAATRARTRRFAAHRAWAIRLFALVIGSWLYRMEYGFWFLTVGRLGHTHAFRGAFDAAMAFLFYLPNLVVAELFIRARQRARSRALAIAGTTALIAASLFVVVATGVFTVDFWGPGLRRSVLGEPRRYSQARTPSTRPTPARSASSASPARERRSQLTPT